MPAFDQSQRQIVACFCGIRLEAERRLESRDRAVQGIALSIESAKCIPSVGGGMVASDTQNVGDV